MDGSRKPTLRERSKLEKRSRIERAAREIFAEQGFDKATTREIARRAEVGVATLFVYAADKTELLKWMFESELERIGDAGIPVSSSDSLATELLRYFKPRYELWLRDPRLSRTAMRVAFGSLLERADDEVDRPRQMIWAGLERGIRDIVVRKQQRGLVRSDADPDLVAKAVFSIYLTQVQLWISQKNPRLEDGLAALSSLFGLLCEAIRPA